ncbi:phytanoyl-CoA dioxygenase family protein [Streptomyces sp. NPDC057682]|uniref:HalD/BesD family halogenase n=1 Tax=Streptomyces sp. NPDC057682 TaxID=3346210 RepID=UPI00368E584E
MTSETLETVSLDARIGAHLAQRFSPAKTAELTRSFAEDGFALLTGLVPDDLFQSLSAEVDELVSAARRIDIEIPATGNTPRAMSTVNRGSIHRGATLIPEIYRSPALKEFLGRIAGEEVIDCPWDDEQYVITRQHRAGDTHGWHWGDFPFTLIWLFDVPEHEAGGALQTVPHSHWNKQDPQVGKWLAATEPKTWTFRTGDIYLLRSDTTLHRTTPLTRDVTRTILNTCWGGLADLDREQSHETMSAMFGDDAGEA